MTRQAQEVGIAQQQASHAAIADRIGQRSDGLRWAAPAVRFWSWLLNAMVGYGFRTWRVLSWLTAVYVVGLLVFGLAWRVEGLLPTEDPPRVFALPAYTFDVLVPLVDLGQRKAWLPIPAAFPNPAVGWVVVAWYWLSNLAGWLLGTIAIAGLTGILRRD